ncbi:MAG: glycosyltransferase family 39 protein [Microgenomates group bacterium]
MKVNNYLVLFAISAIYFASLFFYRQNPFVYRMDPHLIGRYYLSQDITHEVDGKRLFLSDDEIHIAAGYLYAMGENPVDYNFQHPPLIKYMFGFMTRLTDNPYLVQVILSVALLMSTYYLALRISESKIVAMGAVVLLSFDRLFISFSTQALLDLGQSVLIMLYLITSVYFRDKYWLQGIVLGLLLTAKFWAGSLFFIVFINSYLMLRKQFNLRRFIYQLGVGSVMFCLVYLRSFVAQRGAFNIIFFELKTLKYWFHHSVSSVYGASLILFTTGYLKSWWGAKEVLRAQYWSLVWPIGLCITAVVACKRILREKLRVSPATLIYTIPVTYLGYLSIQAAYERYFIILLPYLYIGLSSILTPPIMKKLRRR